MLENEALRGDTVIDTLVNMSSDEMREDTVVKTLANIADGDVPDDVIGALLAAFGAPESLRGETVVETIENIVQEAGVTDDVPDDFIGALLMLGDVSGGGDTTGVNLFAVSDASDGYIHTNGGYVSSVNDNHPMISDYISVRPGQSLVFQAWALEDSTASGNTRKLWMAYAFYDSNKSPLSGRTDRYGGTTQSSGYAYNIYTVTVPEGASYVRVCSRRVFGGYAKLEVGSEPTPWTPCPKDVAVVINEASVCSANDAYLMPPLAVTVFGKSVQDGTPTPSVPVAIDSVGTCSITMTGRNLLPVSQNADSTNNGITYTNNNDGTWTLNGTATNNSYCALMYASASEGGIVGLPKGMTFCFSATQSQINGLKLSLRVKDVATNSTIKTFSTDEGDGTWTNTNDGVSVADSMYVNVSRGVRLDNITLQPMLQFVSSPAEWVPHAGSNTPIDLDGHELRGLPDGACDLLTVGIDGSVSLVQCVGVVDLGTLAWETATAGRYKVSFHAAAIPASDSTKADILCTSYAVVSAYSTAAKTDGIAITTKGNIVIYDANLAGSSIADFTTAMSGVMLYYTLATPTVVDLDPVSLPALPAPEFNTWADTDVPTTLTMRYMRA